MTLGKSVGDFPADKVEYLWLLYWDSLFLIFVNVTLIWEKNEKGTLNKNS